MRFGLLAAGPVTAAVGWVESPPFWQPAKAKTGIKTNNARIDFRKGCTALPPCWPEFLFGNLAYHPHNGRLLQWRLFNSEYDDFHERTHADFADR